MKALFPLFLLQLAAAPLYAASGTAIQGKTAKEHLDRIAAELDKRRGDQLERFNDDYIEALEHLESDATRASDSVVAAAADAEKNSKDIGLAPMQLSGARNSALLTKLRGLRAANEKDRMKVEIEVLAWCQTELSRLEKLFLAAGDPESAALIHKEVVAVSRPPLIIVAAVFGANGANVDTTLRLRKAIRFNRLSIQGGRHLAGDPVPYARKQNAVTWQFGTGKRQNSLFAEDAQIVLPPP